MVSREFVNFAHQLADAAGDVCRKYFRSDPEIYWKDAGSPIVTQADQEAEAVMRGMIGRTYPHHGIWGEEAGSEQLDAEFVWVLDPIDGTVPFSIGKCEFSNLIGLCQNQKPVLGIMNQPILNERWLGIRGQPTTYNGKPTRTRGADVLKKARICFSSPLKGAAITSFERMEALRENVHVIAAGGHAYNTGLIVNGWADATLETAVEMHDFLPLIPIVEGAGGVISDWQGLPLGFGPSEWRFLVAANPQIHAELIRVLDIKKQAA